MMDSGIQKIVVVARQTIRYLQPFNPMMQLPIKGQMRPFDARTFLTLRNLCNIDKHRHLHLIVAKTDGIGPIDFGDNQPPRRRSERPLIGKGTLGKIETDMTIFLIDDDYVT